MYIFKINNLLTIYMCRIIEVEALFTDYNLSFLKQLKINRVKLWIL